MEGFFKGVGKGMVGLVTRPASGLVDLASGSFSAVKRATEAEEAPLTRQRPARVFGGGGSILPYVRRVGVIYTIFVIINRLDICCSNSPMHIIPVAI